MQCMKFMGLLDDLTSHLADMQENPPGYLPTLFPSYIAYLPTVFPSYFFLPRTRTRKGHFLELEQD